MSDLGTVLPALTLFTVAAVSPGPSNLLVIETTVSRGRSDGLSLAAGVSSGTFLWAFASSIGVSALLLDSPLYPYLLAFGVLYLLKLAYGSLRTALHPPEVGLGEAPGRAEPRSMARMYVSGLATSLSNPKSALFWISIMSVALGRGASGYIGSVVVLGCTAIAVIIYGSFAVMFQHGRTRSFYNRNVAKIGVVFAIVYLALALKLALSSIGA